VQVRPLIAVTLGITLLIPTTASAANPNAGATCKTAGATSTYAGKKYTCVKSGKKLVWNKGVKVAKVVNSTATVSQINAKRSAANYLSYSAFSRSGLIDQLVFEGFSQSDATYGVDSVNPDWKNQAAKSAANYLSYSAFSRSGLIDQLVFEGFTQDQAEYGVSTTGL
jgi:hypothetical protein